MPDIVICGVSDATVAEIDRHAHRHGYRARSTCGADWTPNITRHPR